MPTTEARRVQQIRQLHSDIEGVLRTSLAKAIRIGELLREQKAELEHGEWGPWIKANLPFTHRTADNYLRLYREREKIKLETISNLAAAYRLLNQPEQHKQKRKSNKKRPADPPPSSKRLMFELTNEEDQEFTRIAGKLLEVFQVENVKGTILEALRYAYKELVDENNSPRNGTEFQLGGGTNGQVSRPTALRHSSQRRVG